MNTDQEKTLEMEMVDSENIPEENEESGAPLTPEDYRVITDLLDELREQYRSLKSFYENYIDSTYSLNPKILNAILPITKEKIETMSLEEMCDFIEPYSGTTNLLEDMMNITKQLEPEQETLPVIDPVNGEVPAPKDNLEEEFRKIMMDIKKSSMSVYTQKREVDHAMEESNKILEEYINYLSSDKVRESREKYLENLKETLTKTEDGPQKKRMEKMIADIEASYDLSFMFNRFKELGDAEVTSIIEAFFNNSKGKYVMNRFNSKIKAFGFTHTIFNRFLNLEEMFLPEEYHPYNNLFLFTYIRMVAYADPYNKTDKMWVQALTSNISNLVYHRFENDRRERIFIDLIKQVDDYFSGYETKFIEENETWPGHASRQFHDNDITAKRKKVLTDKLDELGITDYDADWDADTLQKYFEDELNKMIDDQKDDFPSEITEEDIEDDVDDDEESTSELPIIPVVE